VPNYSDSGHRPHGIHTGEEPRNEITNGPESISVTLDTWGPKEDLFTSLYDALQSNWGDVPSRSIDQPHRSDHEHTFTKYGGITGWSRLTDKQREYVESCFAGKTLPQVLESISFRFLIDGVSRAATHQLVRSRVGAAFMQHGGRDNDWRHRPFTMPETVRRACGPKVPPVGGAPWDGLKGQERRDVKLAWFADAMKTEGLWGLKQAVIDLAPIDKLIDDFAEAHDNNDRIGLRDVLEDYLMQGRRIYAALVDAGIPWQDARRFLWTGQQSYLHADYNYLALKGVCARRLEHVMDWEINCVAQLMVREVKMKCPPIFGKYLISMSDQQGRAAFAGLDSWPPDGKYPVSADVAASPRMHRPEQNPFWVLHPDSMAGGPIHWVPTNGVYPKEF